MSVSRHLESAGYAEAASWEAFVAAIQVNLHASCCGAGGGGATLARRTSPPVLFAQGRAGWEASVRSAAPLLPWLRGRFVLPGVRLADPGAPPSAPVDLLIAEGRIERIAPAGATQASAEVIEALRGHYVAPALADLHVHMPAATVLRLSPLFLLLTLRHGIVRVRDAGDPDGSATPAALGLVRSGALPGPDIHYAYAFVGDGRARWGNTLRYADRAEAPAIVARLRAAGASWVKAYENLDAPRIAALVEAASDAGLQVMGHVSTGLTIEAARLPDAQHGFGVPDPATLRRDHVLNRAIDWQSVTPERIRRVVDACAEHGLAMTPTLSTSRNLLRLADWQRQRAAPDVALLPRVYPEVIWHPAHGLPAYRDIASADFDRARDAWDRKLALVAALAGAGVPLRLGTDTQQPFVVPGAALHTELAAFAAAGINRARAWTWASRDAAQLLGVADTGRLVEGQLADLLVSPTAPFDPGWSPSSISATLCAGACLMAPDLDAAIARELARFEGLFADHLARWLARFALNRTAKRFVG
jgi:hypothetical protein